MSETDTTAVGEAPPIATAPRVTVRNFVDIKQLEEDLSYSLADLGEGMSRQASLMLHWGMVAAKASKQVDDFKLALDVSEGKVYRQLRDAAVSAGEKTTEDQLKRSVAIHPKVVAVKRAINAARQIETNAKAAVEAFKHRKDMLVQHGARDRAELEGEMRIRARSEGEAVSRAVGLEAARRARSRLESVSEAESH